MKSRLSVKFKRGGRRREKHGGYSYLTSASRAEESAVGDIKTGDTPILPLVKSLRTGLISLST